jgi:prepilin peptidase CpaA
MALMSVVVLGVLIAAGFDIKSRRIPNALTFSMILSGLILNTYLNGFSGLGQSALGLLCGILFLILPFAWGGVGAGDVKLVGAIGSLLGPHLVLYVFLASAVFGGILSLIEAIRNHSFKATCSSIKHKVMIAALSGKVPAEKSVELQTETLGIPYACAIACGTLFVLLFLRGI